MFIADKIEFHDKLIKDQREPFSSKTYYNDRRKYLQDLQSNAKFFWHIA